MLPRKNEADVLWGEKEREKSGVSDKTAGEEGFVEEVVFEQRPEVRGELLRWPWEQGDMHLERSQGQAGLHHLRRTESRVASELGPASQPWNLGLTPCVLGVLLSGALVTRFILAP